MTPAYVPFLTADRFDHFWGAKLLIRFTREQIRAVVEATVTPTLRPRSWLDSY